MGQACVVRLIGGFRVEVDGHPVAREAWRRRRGADLVKLLALAPQHRLHRDQVMDSLWPNLGADAAAANLRKAVHLARRALGNKQSIGTDGQLVVLWPEGRLEVDIDQPEGGPGDLLPEDRYTDWIEPHRERLRSQRLQRLRAEGRWEEVLEIDPTDEVACRALMRQHLDHGDRQAAIKRFQRLRDILRVDLCVAPEPQTVALFEEALAMHGASDGALEHAQAVLARGLVQWTEGKLDAAESSAKEARAYALRHGLGRELGEASCLLGMVAMLRGRWPEVFRQEFVSAIELPSEQAPMVLNAHLCLAEASLMMDPVATGQLAHELLEAAMAVGSPSGEALMSFLIGESNYHAAKLDESNEWMSRAAGLYEDLNDSSGLAFALMRLAMLASLGGQRSQVGRYLASARRSTDDSMLVSHLRPRVLEVAIKCCQRSDERHAICGEAQNLVTHARETCPTCSIGLGVAATIASAGEKDIAKARYWLDYADRRASMWSGTPWQAATWEARAALRSAEGDHAQAVALMREAKDLYHKFGHRLDEARCESAQI